MLTDDVLLNWYPCGRDEARALVAQVLRRAQAEGVDLPPPPTEPDNCCGNDCIECVWLAHDQAVGDWRDEAVLRWAP